MPPTNSIGREHRLQRPQEIDALEEAEKQRRVPSGVSEPPILRDEEDEEDEGHASCAARSWLAWISGADQHHGGAGRAEQARRQRAEGEDRRVGRRRADEIAADADAAGDHEQREQQEDEGEVVEQERVQDLGRRRAHAEHDARRARAARAPRRLRPCRNDAPRNAAQRAGGARWRAGARRRGSTRRGSVPRRRDETRRRLSQSGRKLPRSWMREIADCPLSRKSHVLLALRRAGRERGRGAAV